MTRVSRAAPYMLWFWLAGCVITLMGLGLIGCVLWADAYYVEARLLFLRKAYGFLPSLFFLTWVVALVFGLFLRPYRWFWWVWCLMHIYLLAIAFAGSVIPYTWMPFGLPFHSDPVLIFGFPLMVASLLWNMHRGSGPYAIRIKGREVAGLTVLALCIGIWLWGDFRVVFQLPDLLSQHEWSEVVAQNTGLANPLAVPAHILPEWYFLPAYAALRAPPLSKAVGIAAMGLFALAPLLLPLLCTGRAIPFWRNKGLRWQVPLLILSVLLLGIMGAQYASALNQALSGLVLLIWVVLLWWAIPRTTRRR